MNRKEQGRGGVSIGSSVPDTADSKGDSRLIAFGAVPVVVSSEVMGDLKRIAGQSAAEGAGPEAG